MPPPQSPPEAPRSALEAIYTDERRAEDVIDLAKKRLRGSRKGFLKVEDLRKANNEERDRLYAAGFKAGLSGTQLGAARGVSRSCVQIQYSKRRGAKIGQAPQRTQSDPPAAEEREAILLALARNHDDSLRLAAQAGESLTERRAAVTYAHDEAHLTFREIGEIMGEPGKPLDYRNMHKLYKA